MGAACGAARDRDTPAPTSTQEASSDSIVHPLQKMEITQSSHQLERQEVPARVKASEDAAAAEGLAKRKEVVEEKATTETAGKIVGRARKPIEQTVFQLSQAQQPVEPEMPSTMSGQLHGAEAGICHEQMHQRHHHNQRLRVERSRASRQEEQDVFKLCPSHIEYVETFLPTGLIPIDAPLLMKSSCAGFLQFKVYRTATKEPQVAGHRAVKPHVPQWYDSAVSPPCSPTAVCA